MATGTVPWKTILTTNVFLSPQRNCPTHVETVASPDPSWRPTPCSILAVPTAIAGIYGMNFKNMPELEMQFGYHTVMFAIFALCGILYWRFRKNGWL